jgi:2-polyprenyl-3-methyl-5-hydroxy-6-metoxy-1,4-benzoquinol methylase
MKTVEERAKDSRGTSHPAIYAGVTKLLESRGVTGDLIVDVGCGVGCLRPYVIRRFTNYIGTDVIRHPGLPEEVEFRKVDLDSGRMEIPDGAADAVASVETIEHLENPRAFVRELVRISRPGGWIVITTPNQLSFLSKATFLLKNRFNAFQQGDYPAHITALLEIDLFRIARECGLEQPAAAYSQSGRMAFTPWRIPSPASRIFPRSFSDNLLFVARKPGEAPV